MKKNNIYLLLFFLLGCTNPVDDLEIGDPFDQADAVTDTWDLSAVRHVDNLNLAKPYTDISALFSATLEITGTSFTYNQGSGPNFLESSGTWAFDDEEYPEAFIMNSSTELKLGAPARTSSDSLILILERKCEDKVISSYEYYFTRQ